MVLSEDLYGVVKHHSAFWTRKLKISGLLETLCLSLPTWKQVVPHTWWLNTGFSERGWENACLLPCQQKAIQSQRERLFMQ